MSLTIGGIRLGMPEREAAALIGEPDEFDLIPKVTYTQGRVSAIQGSQVELDGNTFYLSDFESALGPPDGLDPEGWMVYRELDLQVDLDNGFFHLRPYTGPEPISRSEFRRRRTVRRARVEADTAGRMLQELASDMSLEHQLMLGESLTNLRRLLIADADDASLARATKELTDVLYRIGTEAYLAGGGSDPVSGPPRPPGGPTSPSGVPRSPIPPRLAPGDEEPFPG